MPRKRSFAALTAAAVLALSVTAQAGDSGNDYQGRAESDSLTYVGFDLTAQDTKVKNFTANLRYHCPEINEPQAIIAVGQGTLAIRKDQTFSGKLNATSAGRGSERLTYKITGKLRKHGKARGTVDAVLTVPTMRGGGTERCYTGGLDWKTKKGAHVVIEVRHGRGSL